MAIQRGVGDYSFKSQDTRQMSTPTVAAARVSPEYKQRVEAPIVPDNNWRQNLLGGIVGTLQKVGEKYIDTELANAYLKGTAGAASGKVEEELEGDPFTKAWQTAGFRDTMGRLSQAQQDAELAQDMVWLKERPPEEMRQYLDEKRSKLMPVLEGMSGDMRMKMIPSIALRDQTAISQHKVQYQQHIWNEQGKGFTAPITQGLNKLTALRELGGDGTPYMNQENEVVMKLLDMRSSNLPRAQKDVLTQELLEYSLTNQHLGLYQALRDKVMPDGIDENGAPVSRSGLSVLEQLPVPLQEKLSAAYLKAKDATNAIANQDFLDTYTMQHESVRNGTTSLNWEQAKAMLDTGTRLKLLTQEQRSKFITDWEHAKFKQDGDVMVGQYYLGNNTEGLASKGKTMADGREQTMKVLRTLPMPERLSRLEKAVDLGNYDAAKMFGEFVAPSIASLSVSDGKISQEHSDALAAMHGLLDKYKGDKGRTVHLLAGIPEEMQTRVHSLRALHESGQTGAMGVARMLELEKSTMNMSKQEKAVVAEGVARDDQKYLDTIGDQGWLGQFWDRGVGVFSREHAIRADMEGTNVLTNADPKARAAVRSSGIRIVQDALRDEMRAMALQGATGKADKRAEMAMAEVMKRTVRAGDTPVILPKGTTPHAYFNLDAKATPISMIDTALSERLKPTTEGGYMDVTITPQGISFQEWDRNGTRVPSNAGILRPSVIGADVGALQKRQLQPIKEALGEGVTYKDKNIEFKYNGVNTAGVREQDMLAFRKDMIEFEGVRTSVYDDLSKKLKNDGSRVRTVGVGVSETNPKHFPKLNPDGTVSPDQVVASFKGATNDAALMATQVQSAVGIQNQASFRLFSGMVYQGQGNAKPFYEAMRSRNKETALAALRETTAYKMSQARRQQYYENLTIAALKG